MARRKEQLYQLTLEEVKLEEVKVYPFSEGEVVYPGRQGEYGWSAEKDFSANRTDEKVKKLSVFRARESTPIYRDGEHRTMRRGSEFCAYFRKPVKVK